MVSVVLFGLVAILRLGVGLFVPFAIRSGASSHPCPPGLFHPRPDAVVFGSETPVKGAHAPLKPSREENWAG